MRSGAQPGWRDNQPTHPLHAQQPTHLLRAVGVRPPPAPGPRLAAAPQAACPPSPAAAYGAAGQPPAQWMAGGGSGECKVAGARSDGQTTAGAASVASRQRSNTSQQMCAIAHLLYLEVALLPRQSIAPKDVGHDAELPGSMALPAGRGRQRRRQLRRCLGGPPGGAGNHRRCFCVLSLSATTARRPPGLVAEAGSGALGARRAPTPWQGQAARSRRRVTHSKREEAVRAAHLPSGGALSAGRRSPGCRRHHNRPATQPHRTQVEKIKKLVVTCNGS